MIRSPASDDLRQTIFALADRLTRDELAPEELDRLNQLICGDPEALQHYVTFMVQSSSLRNWACGRELSDHEETQPLVELPASPTRRAWEATYDVISNYLALSLVVSGLFVAIMLLSMALIVPDWNPIRPAIEPPSVEFVAHITQFRQTRWDESSDGNLKSRSLFVGDKLVLNEGLAVITYDTGARVALEGPATYLIQNANAGNLQLGKLIAQAETVNAQGFSVEIPGARIVDLGTEFVVEVDADGAADVAVLRGAVSFATSGELADRTIRLGVGEAASFHAKLGTPTRHDTIDAQPYVKLRSLIDGTEAIAETDRPGDNQTDGDAPDKEGPVRDGTDRRGSVVIHPIVGGKSAPQLDNAFGKLELAYNFGGGGSQTHDGIEFTNQPTTGNDPTFGTTNGITVSASTVPPAGKESHKFNNADIGDDLWHAFTYTDKGGVLKLRVANLDPGKRYQAQLLFGDNRTEWYGNYVNQTVVAATAGGSSATAKLSFGPATGNHHTLVTIEVSDTTSFEFAMPAANPETSAGPAVAGIVLHSEKDVPITNTGN